MPSRITSLVACLCFGLSTSFLCAQGRTTTTGTTQTGSTGSTTATGATTGAGTSALSGATGNTGSGSGGTGAQMSTGNQPTFNAGDGSVGALIGQNAFTGQGNTGFVGNRNATQGGNTSLLPQFNQQGNQGNTTKQSNTGRSNLKRARPQQRIAFTYPKANLVATQVLMSDRLKRMTGVSGANASISDEGVVTLTGMVASDDSRKLAEALARLEPGVRSVVNELKVETVSP